MLSGAVCGHIKNAMGAVHPWQVLSGYIKVQHRDALPRAREVSRLINRNGEQHKLFRLRGICRRILMHELFSKLRYNASRDAVHRLDERAAPVAALDHARELIRGVDSATA